MPPQRGKTRKSMYLTGEPETPLTEDGVDELLLTVDQSFMLWQKNKDKAVKRSAMELNLLVDLEEVRDIMDFSLAVERRQELQAVFGGSCERTARIQAILDQVELSPMNASDQRLATTQRALQAVEKVLEAELGLGDALRKAREQEKEGLELELEATLCLEAPLQEDDQEAALPSPPLAVLEPVAAADEQAAPEKTSPGKLALHEPRKSTQSPLAGNGRRFLEDFLIVEANDKRSTPGYRLARREEVEPVLLELKITPKQVCSLAIPSKVGGPDDTHVENWINDGSEEKEAHALLVRLSPADFKVVEASEKGTTPGYRLASREDVTKAAVLPRLPIPRNIVCSLEPPDCVGGPNKRKNANWMKDDSEGDETHALLVQEDPVPPQSDGGAEKVPTKQEEAAAAAVKIQAAERGRKARSDVRSAKAAAEAEAEAKAKAETQAPAPSEEETSAAAIKIQALERGRKARNEAQAAKAAGTKSSEAKAEVQTHTPPEEHRPLPAAATPEATPPPEATPEEEREALHPDDFKIVEVAAKHTTVGYRPAKVEEVETVLSQLRIPYGTICSLVPPGKAGGPNRRHQRNWLGKVGPEDDDIEKALLIKSPRQKRGGLWTGTPLAAVAAAKFKQAHLRAQLRRPVPTGIVPPAPFSPPSASSSGSVARPPEAAAPPPRTASSRPAAFMAKEQSKPLLQRQASSMAKASTLDGASMQQRITRVRTGIVPPSPDSPRSNSLQAPSRVAFTDGPTGEDSSSTNSLNRKASTKRVTLAEPDGAPSMSTALSMSTMERAPHSRTLSKVKTGVVPPAPDSPRHQKQGVQLEGAFTDGQQNASVPISSKGTAPALGSESDNRTAVRKTATKTVNLALLEQNEIMKNAPMIPQNGDVALTRQHARPNVAPTPQPPSKSVTSVTSNPLKALTSIWGTDSSVTRPASGLPPPMTSWECFRPGCHMGGTGVPLCTFGCGLPVAPGVTRHGKPFTTCCKECAVGQGHGKLCGCIDPTKVGPGLCKLGCAKPVASGKDALGQKIDTCCRGCAQGLGHDEMCGKVVGQQNTAMDMTTFLASARKDLGQRDYNKLLQAIRQNTRREITPEQCLQTVRAIVGNDPSKQHIVTELQGILQVYQQKAQAKAQPKCPMQQLMAGMWTPLGGALTPAMSPAGRR